MRAGMRSCADWTVISPRAWGGETRLGGALCWAFFVPASGPFRTHSARRTCPVRALSSATRTLLHAQSWSLWLGRSCGHLRVRHGLRRAASAPRGGGGPLGHRRGRLGSLPRQRRPAVVRGARLLEPGGLPGRLDSSRQGGRALRLAADMPGGPLLCAVRVGPIATSLRRGRMRGLQTAWGTRGGLCVHRLARYRLAVCIGSEVRHRPRRVHPASSEMRVGRGLCDRATLRWL